MNKRYMDFVPAPRGAEREASAPKQTEKRPLSNRTIGAGRTKNAPNVVSRSAMPGMKAPANPPVRRPVASRASVATLPPASTKNVSLSPVGVRSPGVRMTSATSSSRNAGLSTQNFMGAPRAVSQGVTKRIVSKGENTQVKPQAKAKPQMILPGKPAPRVVRAYSAVQTEVKPGVKTVIKPGNRVAVAKASSSSSAEAKKRALLRDQLLETALREAELDEPSPKKSRISSLKSLVKPSERGRNASKNDKKDEEDKIPRSPFINTENLDKRPLSGAAPVAPEPVEDTIVEKEDKKGVVTIISKPEKDSKAGLIVAIILTIILGAAAGTIAFLLLPK